MTNALKRPNWLMFGVLLSMILFSNYFLFTGPRCLVRFRIMRRLAPCLICWLLYPYWRIFLSCGKGIH